MVQLKAHLCCQLVEDVHKVLNILPRERFRALQFTIVEDEADPQVVHEGREAEHHSEYSRRATELQDIITTITGIVLVNNALHGINLAKVRTKQAKMDAG